MTKYHFDMSLHDEYPGTGFEDFYKAAEVEAWLNAWLVKEYNKAPDARIAEGSVQTIKYLLDELKFKP